MSDDETRESEAIQQGWDAYWMDVNQDENPYFEGTPEYDDWNKGWNEAYNEVGDETVSVDADD